MKTVWLVAMCLAILCLATGAIGLVVYPPRLVYLGAAGISPGSGRARVVARWEDSSPSLCWEVKRTNQQTGESRTLWVGACEPAQIVDPDLERSTIYWYQVRARREGGPTPWTTEVVRTAADNETAVDIQDLRIDCRGNFGSWGWVKLRWHEVGNVDHILLGAEVAGRRWEWRLAPGGSAYLGPGEGCEMESVGAGTAGTIYTVQGFCGESASPVRSVVNNP